MVDYNHKRIVFVCNVDTFFISHRLPLAIHALKLGSEVFLLTKDTGSKSVIEELGIKFINIPFERSGTNPVHEIKCILLLLKNYRRIKPTVIHHITLKAALLGSLAAKLTKNKNIVNAISGLGYNFTDGRDGILQRIILCLIKFLLKSKNYHIILQNPDDVSFFNNMNLVPEKNIHLIKGSGIDLSTYRFVPKGYDNNNKITILFPARLLADKGLYELIDSAKKLFDEFSDRIVFILAGNCDLNNLASVSEAEIRSLLVPHYIEWIGFQKEMYQLYVNSDIVILPSYREGLPKSLIEACAVGRPIITTDVPGCRECVLNNVNGLLVTAKDSTSLTLAIKKLIQSPHLLEKMGLESRKLAEKEFSIESVIEKTFSIYEKMIM